MVVACGGQPPAPASLPTVSSAVARPTAPPTGQPRTPSTPPPQSTRQAALALVERYYQVLNSLHRTMDAAALASLLAPTCPCRAQVAAVRRAAARGEHYIDHASLNVMRPSVQDTHHAYVLVNLDTRRGGLVSADGRLVTSAPPRRDVQRVFRLVRHGQQWMIASIEVG